MPSESLVAETAARILRDHCDPQDVNRAKSDAWAAPAWSALEDAGLTLAWVPEAQGGAGGSIADGFAVLQEAGRSAAALPLAETLLAGWLLSRAGMTAPKGAMSCGPTRDGEPPTLSANGTLSGRLRAVSFARQARHLVLLARREQGGHAVALVDRAQARLSDGASMAGDPLDAVTLDGVRPLAVQPAPAGLDPRALLLMGATARAVQMTGALEAILDLTVAYANERIAFERPIAKFQAVQHNLARLAGEVAAAIAAAGSAADAIAQASPPPSWRAQARSAISPSPRSSRGEGRGEGPPLASEQGSASHPNPLPIMPEACLRHDEEWGEGTGAGFDDAVFLEAASAKIRVGEAAGEGAAIAHQVLGAIGFTQEHILHRYTRRLWSWRDDFGNESTWAVKLGTLVAARGADGLWPMLAAR